MSDKKKVNPMPEGLPRSPEEFFQQVQGKGKESALKALQRVEENNEQIRRSVAIAQMLKSEGWGFFWENLEGYQELLDKGGIASLTGSVMEKGAQVERIQGKMELMGTIEAEVDFHLQKAKETPIDVQELREKMDLSEDSNNE